jgi:two-component system chemotaxis response regulator CheB
VVVSERVTRVLVVDDSAVVRQTLLALLSETGGFQVDIAANPFVALRHLSDHRPDVIVLDLEMPKMDGLTFLRKIMAENPIPVVVCSAHAGRAALDALDAGAVDVITKPSFGVRGFLEEQVVSIADILRGAAKARLPGRRPSATAGTAGEPAGGERWPSTARPPIVALGASTGGTQALRTVLGSLRPEAPALLIVQHMPPGFTRAFAERLDQESALKIREAQDGDRVEPGHALVAPGDMHLRLREDLRGYFAEVTAGPLVSRHRPSVDVLFRSVAELAGPHAVGVLLTGMGDDGAEGLLAMRRAGAETLVQDEATSVVFGMPKEAIRRGATEHVLPLPAISEAIRALAAGRMPGGVHAERPAEDARRAASAQGSVLR